jgi:hypothetical protein
VITGGGEWRIGELKTKKKKVGLWQNGDYIWNQSGN